MSKQAAIEKSLSTYESIFWMNKNKKTYTEAIAEIKMNHPNAPTLEDIETADLRLKRFAPVFEKLFPETQKNHGIIESELKSVANFQNGIITFIGGRVLGDWDVKLDSHLDIAGSVKARGGVYEVIQYAEKLALEAGLIQKTESNDSIQYSDYTILVENEAKQLFSKHTLIVGSTGNLGLSIGIMGKALGFNVTVHMSQDAKAWKVQMLQEKGVQVILHAADYSVAVKEGRLSAENDPNCYFIDDENSIHLFTGYAVAALRLKEQLDASGKIIDADHPFFVYLPCGVGGAPGGIAYGLKLIYKDDVRLFFAEPTHAPCMLLGMSSQKYDQISVADIGIDTITAADGLAVGRASGFVGQIMSHILDGIYTISDEHLHWLLYMLSISENINLEPSALAGFSGPIEIFYNANGFKYLQEQNLLEKMNQSYHISWATGGGLVPDDVMQTFIKIGEKTKVEF